MSKDNICEYCHQWIDPIDSVHLCEVLLPPKLKPIPFQLPEPRLEPPPMPTIDYNSKNVLETAWQRVATGNMNPDTNTFPSNIKIFDHPRYSWNELERLIKGEL